MQRITKTASLALSFLLPTVTATAQVQPPTNAAGQPVATAGGQPITYSAAQWREAGPVPERKGSGGPTTGNSAADALADWAFFAYGTGIGATGMHVTNVSGKVEIVTSGGGYGFGENLYWFILQHNAKTKGYDQVWVSPLAATNNGIRDIESVDLIPGGTPEVVVGLKDGTVEVWLQAARVRIATFKTSASDLQDFEFVDVDGDKKLDILVCNKTTTYAYDLAGKLLATISGVGGFEIVAAEMDGDKGLELAATNGTVYDLGTKKIQWTWSKGFGANLEAADIDNDGKAELIAADAWTWIWSFDVDKQLPKWSLKNFNTGAIAVGDIDGDGKLELLVGDNQWGEAKAYDVVTLTKEWGIRNPEHGTTEITFGDVDGDGTMEVLWGAGYTSTGQDNLFVGDWKTKTIEWRSVHLDGPFHGPMRGDVDGDGTPEIVTVTTGSRSGYGGATIVVLDGAALTVRATSTALRNKATMAQLANVDADKALEIVIANGGLLEVYDWNGTTTFTKSWSLNLGFSDSVQSFEFGDFDGDGKLEVLIGTSQFLLAYEYATQKKLSQSFYLGGFVRDIALGDSDFDGKQEIHCLSSDGGIYVFDAKTRAADAILQAPSSSIKYGCVGFYRTGGVDVLLGGRTDGSFDFYIQSKSKYLPLGPIPFVSDPLDSILAVLPEPFVISGSGGRLAIHRLNQLLWRTANYGTGFGKRFVDFPHNGKFMAVSGGRYGLAGFYLK